MANYAESLSHSKMTAFKLKHTWKIENFIDQIQSNSNLITSNFDALQLGFTFSLQANIAQDDYQDKLIGLYLSCFNHKHRYSIEGKNIVIDCELALRNTAGDEACAKEFSKVYSSAILDWGYDCFAELSTIVDPQNGLLHDGHQLVIECQITVRYNEIMIHNLPIAKAVDEETCFKALQKKLLSTGNLSDFTIVVGEAEIAAHKLILSTQSAYFKQLFQHSQGEVQFNRLIVEEGTSVESMRHLLEFIYTGEKPSEERLASLELLTLAYKYREFDLMSFCSLHLAQSIDKNNVVAVYMVAAKHQDNYLTTSCLNFIAANFDCLKLPESFKQMCRQNGTELIDIYRMIGNIRTNAMSSPFLGVPQFS